MRDPRIRSQIARTIAAGVCFVNVVHKRGAPLCWVPRLLPRAGDSKVLKKLIENRKISKNQVCQIFVIKFRDQKTARRSGRRDTRERRSGAQRQGPAPPCFFQKGKHSKVQWFGRARPSILFCAKSGSAFAFSVFFAIQNLSRIRYARVL